MTVAAVPTDSVALPRLPVSLDPWLPRVGPGDVAALNALYRHRRPIEALVAGQTVSIETTARSACEPGAYAFRLALGGRPAFLRVSGELVQLCARAVAVKSFGRLQGVAAALLLELSLLRLLKGLESALDMDIRVLERIPAMDSTVGLVPLHFAVRGLPGGLAGIDLFLDRTSAAVIAQALDAFAAPSAATAKLRVPVRVCVDGVDLTLAELRSLRAGDIVLGEGSPDAPRPITTVIGERWQARLDRADGVRFRLASGPVDARADHAGDWFMQQTAEAPRQAVVDEKDLDQLAVRLVFELGRLELPLGEVRRLAPGYLLPMARPSESAVDLVANGRRIAYGSLVKIGDSVGVRVEGLVADE